MDDCERDSFQVEREDSGTRGGQRPGWSFGKPCRLSQEFCFHSRKKWKPVRGFMLWSDSLGYAFVFLRSLCLLCGKEARVEKD